MGTRIHVFLAHDLPRFDDGGAVLARLGEALPNALAVRDYWRLVDPPGHELERWEAGLFHPRLPQVRYFEGPGSLQVAVTRAAARISTGARWRGFLSIGPLRRVHLTAFGAIARVLHSSEMAICADSVDDVTDVFLADGSQEDCIACLTAKLGPPQGSVEGISAEIVAQAERGVPGVWYLEGV